MSLVRVSRCSSVGNRGSFSVILEQGLLHHGSMTKRRRTTRILPSFGQDNTRSSILSTHQADIFTFLLLSRFAVDFVLPPDIPSIYKMAFQALANIYLAKGPRGSLL